MTFGRDDDVRGKALKKEEGRDGGTQGGEPSHLDAPDRPHPSGLPEDERTAQQREEDDQAEDRHWQDCLNEGYEAARDYAEDSRRRSWPSRLLAAARKLLS